MRMRGAAPGVGVRVVVAVGVGLRNYFEFAKDNNYEHLDTFKRAKIRLEVLTELAKIIEDEK